MDVASELLKRTTDLAPLRNMEPFRSMPLPGLDQNSSMLLQFDHPCADQIGARDEATCVDVNVMARISASFYLILSATLG